MPDVEYIERMETEFKETFERYSKTRTYLGSRINSQEAGIASTNDVEIEMLQQQF